MAGLSIRISTTSPLNDDNKPKYKGHLEAGETLQALPFVEDAHESFVYFVLKGTAIKGVRKIVVDTPKTEGAFEGAKNEIIIYRKIKEIPGWKSHFLPFTEGHVTQKTAVLDFDFVPGSDLVEYVNTRKPSKEKLAKLLRHAKAALDVCHKNKILHGDIKPDNFYVSADGEHCYIFDFGNGYMEDDIDKELLTQEGVEMDRMIERVLARATGGGRKRRAGQTRRRKVARGTKKGRR